MRKKDGVRLDIPFYKQHYDFSCGPASVMMGLKYFDEKLTLSSELEMDIWREANMVEIYGTSRYGLALSVAKRGFRVCIFANIKRAGYMIQIEPPIGSVDERMFSFFFRERRERCKKIGVVEKRIVSISRGLLQATLAANMVPVVLSNTEYFSAENMPHWIVISGVDKKRVFFNNPLSGKEGESVPLASLKDIIGYKGDQCMIAFTRK